jgi:hypothetical protein
MKREFSHHLLLVATISQDGSISVTFSTVPSSSPSPHAIEGLFIMTPAAHGCCSFAMAVKMQTVIAKSPGPVPARAAGFNTKKEDKDEKPGSTAEVSKIGRQETAIGRGVTRAAAALKGSETGLPLSPGEAGVLIDDLLSLVPTMFKLYDRSAEVDDAALLSFADFFARAEVELWTGERGLLAKAAKFNDGKVRRHPERAKRVQKMNWWQRRSNLLRSPPPPPRRH